MFKQFIVKKRELKNSQVPEMLCEKNKIFRQYAIFFQKQIVLLISPFIY